MLTHLQTLPPDQEGIAALFQTVADGMQQALAARDPGHDLLFEFILSGPDTVNPSDTTKPVLPNTEYPAHDHRPAEARITSTARNLDSALRLLHSHSGFFICHTRGEISGALLEIALMADHHLMDAAAVLIPGGIFDNYVPRVFGWSRLMERAGAGRASSLLLTCARLSAPQALATGLCEAIEQAASDDATVQRASRPGANTGIPMSVTALRLAHEISERTTRTGGITPRQARVLERAAFALAFSTGDPREGIASFFADRPARFATADAGRQDSVQDPLKA